MRPTLLIAIMFLLMTSLFKTEAQVQTVSISEGWEIRGILPENASPDLKQKAKKVNRFFEAKKMPAMVHDILLDHQLIDTPWLADGAEKCTWVSELAWEYQTKFAVADPEKQTGIRFPGLDGIATIILNDEEIAFYANCYMPLELPVTGKLKKNNSLRIVFSPLIRNGDPVRTTVNGDPVRRPGQNYSNYLGPYPYFSRVGVFGEIQLVSHKGSLIREFLPLSDLDSSLLHGSVSITSRGIITDGAHKIRYRITDPEGVDVTDTLLTLVSDEGKFNITSTIPIDQPRLWWPRGYGNQALYRISATLIRDGIVQQEIEKRIGFRYVTMTEPLHFQVNGYDVKWWGGDWVTPHWNTMVWDHQKAVDLLHMAEHANFNAFRIWGVVEKPPDDFYEMAAEQGFLLWQDFTQLPLGPGNNAASTREIEGTYLLKRLRHYPSIVVWCGGNENAMWHSQEYNGPMEDRGTWDGAIGAAQLKALVENLAPGNFFMPSSPYYGIDPNDPKHGNTHGYTNMWFVPGYDYLNFASEDTRISAPPVHSILKWMQQGDAWPENYSPIYKEGDLYPFPDSWLRYTTSRSWKKLGPVEHYYDGHDLDEMVYRIGMASAEYYRETIEQQRRGRPADDTTGYRQCGGYMVWKYNDSWPQVYSAKVDYFLEPYHTYYALKDVYSPVLVSIEMDTYIRVWVVNDTREQVTGTLDFILFHKDLNKTRKKITRQVSIAPGASEVCIDLYKEGIGSFREEHILFAELRNSNGKVIHRTSKLADIERNLEFPDAKLDVTVKNDMLRITTDKYAHSVTLKGTKDHFGWFFSDNYFTLLPGEVKYVNILGRKQSGDISIKAWYSPYETIVNWKNENESDQL